MFRGPALFFIVLIFGVISLVFSPSSPRLVLPGTASQLATKPAPLTEAPDSIKNAFNPVVVIHAGPKHASGFFIRVRGQLRVITAAHCVDGRGAILPKGVDLETLGDTVVDNLPIIRVTAKLNEAKFTVIAYPVWIGKKDFAILKLKNPTSIDSFYNSLGAKVTGVLLPIDIDKYIEDYFSEVITVGYPLHLRTRVITRGVLGPPNEFGLFSITSPIAKGNSGGPVMRADTLEVIGVVSTVAVANYMFDGRRHRQYISHLGFMVSFKYVLKALESMGELDGVD
jgi:hypothetical protein